ncbi:DUF3857 domain-containing protein [Pedobacter faecalis]|uniref:DUF3857 domain-containing protein n=1 Tax=Pedobacter faecalis TaxID=3041495 RepID=UPI00254D4767|nr:DUF3857 domain-containing protein [Pedobacter sp. ELA7]
MKPSKRLTVCLLLSACCAAFGQKAIKSKSFKFGNVDPKEFATTVSGQDSAASAVVLFDVGSGSFEFKPNGRLMYVFDRHTRFKILNKEGYSYGNLELPFYQTGGTGTSLRNMEAATYNLGEDGKMVVSTIDKDAKFTERTDKNSTIRKFALPNVKEGSIIEYKYRIVSDFLFTLRPWYFQRTIPTLYSQYDVTIPKAYRYRVNGGGYIYLNPAQEYVLKNFYFDGGQENVDCLHMHYHADSVPGLKTEPFITTIEDHVSKVEFELASITIPGRAYEDYSGSWPKVVKVLKDDENFGRFIDRRSFAKALFKEGLKISGNKDTAMVEVFNYVKSNMKWNEETRLFSSQTNPKVVFDKKTGTSADINLLLLALLKEAGIESYPVLLSTRSNGTHPGLPMLSGFDNVIVAAQTNGKRVFLDATDRNHAPGLVSFENLNHQGLKVDLDNETSEWISVDDEKMSRSNITYNLKLDESGKLLGGKLYLSSSQYAGLRHRNRFISAGSQDEYLKGYRADRPGMGIANYEITNLDKPGEPLLESMDVRIEDNVEEAGEIAYFLPLLFEQTKENPFKLEERKFPVDFAYPNEENYRIMVELPEGYQIQTMPKNEKVSLPDDVASFTFMCAMEGKVLTILSKIAIKKPVFTHEEYHGLKELFKNIVRKQAEQIVLKKI